MATGPTSTRRPSHLRKRQSAAAEDLTTKPGKNRPEGLPRAGVRSFEWAGTPLYFGAPEATAVLAKVPPAKKAAAGASAPRRSAAWFADRLSRASHDLFCASGLPEPTPPSERAEWARDVVKNTRALLANFGMDASSPDPEPPEDAVDVLFRRDNPLLHRAAHRTSGEAQRLFRTLLEVDDFRRAMLSALYPLLARPPQWEKEWWSLCGGIAGVDERPETVAARATLLGVAYLGRCAELAAEDYDAATGGHAGVSSERWFFVQLCGIYHLGFGRWPSHGPDGPTVRFCQAVAERLAGCQAPEGSTPERVRSLRAKLRGWARSDGAVSSQIRNAVQTGTRLGLLRRGP